MQTILITGGDESTRKKKALKVSSIMCQVSREDTSILKPASVTSAIQIAKVRELQRILTLTPFNSPCKVAIIHQINQATLEAQSALLKLLEEPPFNTYIIITAPRAEELLPTIVSRCEIIRVRKQRTENKEQKLESKSQLLTSIFQGGVGERLALAQGLAKDKETAIKWSQKMIIAVRSVLINLISNYSNYSNRNLAQLLRKLQKALLTLEKTNTNVRLLIENLLLEFPKR